MPEPHPVDDITLVWGESLRWDDRRQRLYFVDCGPQTLHWLDGAEPPLQTMQLPSLPTGLALAGDGRLGAGPGAAAAPADNGSPEPADRARARRGRSAGRGPRRRPPHRRPRRGRDRAPL